MHDNTANMQENHETIQPKSEHLPEPEPSVPENQPEQTTQAPADHSTINTEQPQEDVLMAEAGENYPQQQAQRSFLSIQFLHPKHSLAMVGRRVTRSMNQALPSTNPEGPTSSIAPALASENPAQPSTTQPELPASTPPVQQTSNMPQRTATPVNVAPDVAPTIPARAAVHGAPARAYLNQKVTGVLMEGMKRLAKEQPEDPLRVLGEYLLKRSREIEGTC